MVENGCVNGIAASLRSDHRNRELRWDRLVLILRWLYQRSRLQASANWIAVTGKVTHAEVMRAENNESIDYQLHVAYEYVMNGSTLVGRRIAFGQRNYGRKKKAEAEIARYPVGAPVMVWVSPIDPRDAVLERSAPGAMLYLVLGIALVVMAVVIAMYGKR